MKNKWIKGIAAFLSAAVLCTRFAACGGGEGEGDREEDQDVVVSGDTFAPSEKQAFLGPIRQDEYLFGMGEIASDTMGGGIDGVTGEWLAETAGAIGAQSMRVWMHIPNIIERAAYSNEVTLKKHVAEGYHDYFAALKENGVKRIVVMNHQFLYPYDYVKRDVNDLQVAIHPIEEPEFYETWIQMYYECYKLLAEEFPEITFWECGNEFDSIPFFRRNDGTLMSAEDMGYIDADLCYAANKAIKEVNPNNACVFPALTCNQYSMTVLDSAYTYIESGVLPTLEEYRVTDPDDYWDVVAWHPYAGGIAEQVKSTSLDLYEVMCEHGDSEKRVFFTEIGINDRVRSGGAVPSDEILQEVADDWIAVVEMIEKDLPFVESFFVFRVCDNVEQDFNGSQDGFGIFHAPLDEENPGKPKPVALALFHYFNGEDADEAPLYAYYNQVTGAIS